MYGCVYVCAKVTDMKTNKRNDRIDLRIDPKAFVLNAEQWEAFQAALDAPPRSMPQLERLMRKPDFFEASAAEN
jgi:uncharacterized protein (DUF1778 family)